MATRRFSLYRVYSEVSHHEGVHFNDETEAYKHLAHVQTLYPRKDYRLYEIRVTEVDVLPAVAPEVPKGAIFSGEFNHASATVAAVVSSIAHKVLRGELDWSFYDIVKKHPALQGLTRAQIDAAIEEATS